MPKVSYYNWKYLSTNFEANKPVIIFVHSCYYTYYNLSSYCHISLVVTSVTAVLFIHTNNRHAFASKTPSVSLTLFPFTLEWKLHHYYLTTFTYTLTQSVWVHYAVSRLLALTNEWKVRAATAMSNRRCRQLLLFNKMGGSNTKLVVGQPRRLVVFTGTTRPRVV